MEARREDAGGLSSVVIGLVGKREVKVSERRREAEKNVWELPESRMLRDAVQPVPLAGASPQDRTEPEGGNWRAGEHR